MTKQAELVLENNFIEQLEKLGYKYVKISNEKELIDNLKQQLEKHNNVQLSQNEFSQVLHHLNKGNIFQRAKTLRDKMQVRRDDGQALYLEFLNLEFWCQNEYQVTSQVRMEGRYRNRYDVTILINGLPLVQIELKRRGLELKEAFNQTNRYQRHSFGAGQGLFLYIQLFIISNGINTKYYANNRLSLRTFKQTFFWTTPENKRLSRLEAFADVFLEPCHLSKMVCKYMVLQEADKMLMVLRPYQYYAAEALVETVRNNGKNGYIWHTTGSGKTLTSFKASQVLMQMPEIHKVVFVVDRRDLDYQTAKEFNNFSKGSVDSTTNTKMLVKQFLDGTKLIVTTLQKLNYAIQNVRYLERMKRIAEKRMVFIFDECHRSHFGMTHARIISFFKQVQLFGFTGTPIFADNAIRSKFGKRTTKDLFGRCLHKYVITDAIRDENVLKFSVEYVGRYRKKDESATELDIEVEDIDRKELLESPQRLGKIANYILQNHARKTHGRIFTAMFCISRVEILIKYYELLQAKRNAGEHNYRIATIFSFQANEDDKETLDFMRPIGGKQKEEVNEHTRDKLEGFIQDYNKLFGTNFTCKDSDSYYLYYKDISKRVRNREIDILLVVNMFLTGFDSKPLNTLYVDKNLKHHGLIQAYSRTNRILGEQKSQGNIVSFRNLKKATDDAVALFSNKEAKEEIFMAPYEDYIRRFNAALTNLRSIAPTVDSVDELPSEEEDLEFVKAFRELIRLRNVMKCFSDFTFDDLEMEEQEFEDYKSKYLDLYDSVKNAKNDKEKASILEDVDFELELIHRDNINVAYILRLLGKMKEAKQEEQKQRKEEILKLLNSEAQLRSKRELIEEFIEEHLPLIEHVEDIEEAFEVFWTAQRKKAFAILTQEEGLIPERLETIIEQYLFTGREPLRDDIVNALQKKPKLLQRRKIVPRVIEKVVDFVQKFIES